MILRDQKSWSGRSATERLFWTTDNSIELVSRSTDWVARDWVSLFCCLFSFFLFLIWFGRSFIISFVPHSTLPINSSIFLLSIVSLPSLIALPSSKSNVIFWIYFGGVIGQRLVRKLLSSLHLDHLNSINLEQPLLNMFYMNKPCLYRIVGSV